MDQAEDQSHSRTLGNSQANNCANCDRPDAMDDMVQCGECEGCRNCLPLSVSSRTTTSSTKAVHLQIKLKQLAEKQALEKRHLAEKHKLEQELTELDETRSNRSRESKRSSLNRVKEWQRKCVEQKDGAQESQNGEQTAAALVPPNESHNPKDTESNLPVGGDNPAVPNPPKQQPGPSVSKIANGKLAKVGKNQRLPKRGQQECTKTIPNLLPGKKTIDRDQQQTSGALPSISEKRNTKKEQQLKSSALPTADLKQQPAKREQQQQIGAFHRVDPAHQPIQWEQQQQVGALPTVGPEQPHIQREQQRQVGAIPTAVSESQPIQREQQRRIGAHPTVDPGQQHVQWKQQRKFSALPAAVPKSQFIQWEQQRKVGAFSTDGPEHHTLGDQQRKVSALLPAVSEQQVQWEQQQQVGALPTVGPEQQYVQREQQRQVGALPTAVLGEQPIHMEQLQQKSSSFPTAAPGSGGHPKTVPKPGEVIDTTGNNSPNPPVAQQGKPPLDLSNTTSLPPNFIYSLQQILKRFASLSPHAPASSGGSDKCPPETSNLPLLGTSTNLPHRPNPALPLPNLTMPGHRPAPHIGNLYLPLGFLIMGHFTPSASQLAARQIDDLRIPQCYFTGATAETYAQLQLHIFVDASDTAFSAVEYFSAVEPGGEADCSEAASKIKVASLKPLSIPRKELQATVLGSRLTTTGWESHTVQVQQCVLWNDSATVLAWLRADHRRYKQYVACRVGELLSTTDVAQWRWVPSKLNPTDAATKWGKVPSPEATDVWFKGQEFIRYSEESWPNQATTSIPPEEELRPDFVVLESQILDAIEDVSHFFMRCRLLRAVAYVHHFVGNYTRRRRGEKPETLHLTVEEQKKTTNMSVVTRMVQWQAYPVEMIELTRGRTEIAKTSSLYQMSPAVDENGVLRIDPHTPFVTRFPVILPTLTKPTKWCGETKALVKGDLVLIVDDTRRNGWVHGRVLEAVAGKHGRVRETVIQTAREILRRPVAKLAALEIKFGGKTGPVASVTGWRMLPLETLSNSSRSRRVASRKGDAFRAVAVTD